MPQRIRRIFRTISGQALRGLCTSLEEMWNQCLSKLTEASSQAVDTLTDLLSSPSDSVKPNAAKTMLTIGQIMRESIEFDSRIRELEARQTPIANQLRTDLS